jgi:PIN domain nuclease of toxin-antitoxin system
VILLDTHMALALTGQTRLDLPGAILHTLLEGNSNYVSAASLWEIAIKCRKGKLRLTYPLSKLVGVLESYGCSSIPISPEDSVADAEPSPLTRDPFDRLLLAQCRVRNWRLLTIDRALAGHPLAWRPAAI